MSSDDETARIWDLSADRELFRLKPSSGPMGGVAFDPTGELIATSIRSPSLSQELGARIGAIASGRVLFPAAIRMASTPDSGNAWSTTDCWSTKSSETWPSWAL